MNKAPLRILLIEDNPADAELIQYELRRAEIHLEIRCVASKREFVKELRDHPPDAIISDYSMPQFDALDALRAAREHRAGAPFILVTGSQSEEVAVQCIQKGADDYILKSSLKRLPSALIACVQKKRVEREHAVAEERMREQAALLNKARDAILVIDLSGTVTFWNNSAERLYGWPREEVVNKLNAAALTQVELAAHDAALETALKEGEWQGELRQGTRDRREIVVESRWSLVRDQENQPRSILVINTDITEKKRLETQFLRAQRLESIGTLAGGIAHDLNNVLTPILVSIRLLREMKGDAPPEVLDTLEASAERGAGIVQQVLSFARGAEGEKLVLEIKHPLNEVLKMCRDVFPPGVQLRADLPEVLWPVVGDPTQLHQVFMNLALNARDAMPAGGLARFEAENLEIDENYARMQPDAKPGRYVMVAVSDSGTGIGPDVLTKIFEPFFTTKEVGKGTGLGLSTTLGIVRGHGGFLSVYSEIGKGSCFKVYLPAAECSIAPQPKGTDTPAPQGRGESILVVDDEPAIRDVIKATLQLNGYRVQIATDGAEGVAAFAEKRKRFGAVMIDLMMPYMDGIAAMRALRRIDPAVRLVAISGLVDQSRLAQITEIGGVRFLAKPFTSEQLLETLRAVLQEPRVIPSALVPASIPA